MEDDKVGQIVGGAYELLAPVGAGGQSVVYRARDLSGGEEVAVKVLRTNNADPDAKERMWREGMALHNLNHTPAALQIRGQYWMPDGSLSLVTDLLHGLDLDAYLEKQSERLTLSDTLRIFEPVSATLAEAHRQGVIHRDLKPGNIFIIDPERGGGIRLLDFGFAKFMRLRSFPVEATRAGARCLWAPLPSSRRGKDVAISTNESTCTRWPPWCFAAWRVARRSKPTRCSS